METYLLLWDIGGIEFGDSCNLDQIPFDRMRDLIVEQYQRGGLNTISWHTFNPISDGDSWDISHGMAVSKILVDKDLSCKFDLWLDRVSEFLLSLKDDKGAQIPIIFRPWHENNGCWFWWGMNYCVADDYIAIWRSTIDNLKRKHGIEDIIIVYSPNFGVTQESFIEYYPRDDYVDMLGIDVYQFNGADGATTYMKSLDESLKLLTQMGQLLVKPIALTETGCESIPMNKWWSEVLYPSISQYPISYVLLWRNAWDRPEHHYGPYPKHISAEDFRKFYNYENTIFLKELNKL